MDIHVRIKSVCYDFFNNVFIISYILSISV